MACNHGVCDLVQHNRFGYQDVIGNVKSVVDVFFFFFDSSFQHLFFQLRATFK